MEPTVKAIIARNLGSIKHAIMYCRTMAKHYPALRSEYKGYIVALRLTQILGR